MMKLNEPVFIAAVQVLVAVFVFLVTTFAAGWPVNFIPALWAGESVITYVLVRWAGERR